MKIYLDKQEIDINDLRNILETTEKVVELMDVDGSGNLYFEQNGYGEYY